MINKDIKFHLLLVASTLLLSGCSPTVKLETPDKPIVVDLRVHIDHTLHVQVQKDVEEAIKNKPEIF